MTEERIMAIRAGITGLLGVLTALWGWFGWMIVLWIFLMLTDWAAGSILAGRRGDWRSARLREGVWHKLGMVLTFLVALAADWLVALTLEHLPLVKLPFDYTVLLAPLVLVWYIVGELGSLAEHAVSTGAPVPGWLLQILEAGKKAVDAAGNRVGGGPPGGEKPQQPGDEEDGRG